MIRNRVKMLRTKKGVTQQECSEETGISITSLKRYERGVQIGDVHNLKCLSEYFGVSMDYLYGYGKD